MSNARRKSGKKVNATAVRRGHQLPTRVNDDLWALLQSEARLERRSVSQTVIILLEEALRERGRNVPPAIDPE